MEVVPANHEVFYRELTLRNSGFIAEAEQERLRRACVLVAGCGSTGGSVVEPLVRLGAEDLVLVDNGTYELNNANRQNMTIADVGEHKVAVLERRCRSINPYCRIATHPDGVTIDNVNEIVQRADVVVDAVDVTSRAGLQMKHALHVAAARRRKPVICGYDMAAAQYVSVLDYRDPELAPLGGMLDARLIDTLDPMTCCALLVPGKYVPPEMFAEIDRHYRREKSFVSQLGIAANLFGVLGTALVLDLLERRPVKTEIYVDVWAITRDRRVDQETELRAVADRDRLEQFVRAQLG
jgi:molybdopterin/thiamine biosynthesis adenylyltransferase